MASMKKDGRTTRSATISTQIGTVVEKHASDYNASARPTTRAGGEDDDMAVYEITLENSDGTQGFSLVADEQNPTVIAYTETGAVADTVFNPGLRWWIREASKAMHYYKSDSLAVKIGPRVRDSLAIWTPPIERTLPPDDGPYIGDPGGSITDPRWGHADLFDDAWDDPLYYFDMSNNEEFLYNFAYLDYFDEQLLAPDMLSGFTSETYTIPTKWSMGSPIAWDQGYPYNMAISARNADGSKGVVGCFGIAAASIINYWRYLPGDISWCDWGGFEQWRSLIKTETSDPPMLLCIEAAELCKVIAEDSGATTWHLDQFGNSVGSVDGDGRAVMQAFQNVFNYHIVQTKLEQSYYADEHLIHTGLRFLVDIEMIANRPVLIGATNSTWLDHSPYNGVGHIWVIDGFYVGWRYLYYIRREPRHSLFRPNIYNQYRRKVGINMLHMNWGQGGKSNGWYASFTPWDNPLCSFDSAVSLFTQIYPNE